MEHVIFHFILYHLNRNHIINKHQHGFRPSYSCQSQLLSLTDDILRAMDNKKQVRCRLSFPRFAKPLTRYHTDGY